RFLSGYDKVLATAAPKNPQLILQGNELLNGCDYSSDIVDNNTDADSRDKRSMEIDGVQTSASSASSVTEFDDEFAVTSCEHVSNNNSNDKDKDHKSGEEAAATSAVSYNDIFRRKWEYYFAYCEGAFATRTLGCSQLVFTRTYNEDLSNSKLLA
ncbi:hypothetical protein LPJ64_005955, partial [Coemansia asiatica]